VEFPLTVFFKIGEKEMATGFKTFTTYDWVVEYTDQHGDIQDCEYFDTLHQIGKRRHLIAEAIGDEICAPVIGLHKGIGNEEDGYQDRVYAYPTGEILPEVFEDGSRIPIRFQKELDKWSNDANP